VSRCSGRSPQSASSSAIIEICLEVVARGWREKGVLRARRGVRGPLALIEAPRGRRSPENFQDRA
jgi:hypothetical protein